METYCDRTMMKVGRKNVQVDVLTGWSINLKRFFLIIIKKDSSAYVYRSLDHNQMKNGIAKYSSIAYLEKRAKSFGVTLNSEIVKKMQLDKMLVYKAESDQSKGI